ncbi:MAG: prepilin-type N-terminal cleavage/methylation domain-containing protein [Patescibacteria group bacterium]
MNQRGITLIELLIYLALVSGMLVSFIYYTIGVTASAVNTNQTSELIESGRLAFNLMLAKTRSASSVVEPLPSQSSNKLKLSFGGLSTLTFEVVNNMLIAKDENNNSWSLTPLGVSVTELNFTRVDNGLVPANININFGLGNYHWQSSVNQKISP